MTQDEIDDLYAAHKAACALQRLHSGAAMERRRPGINGFAGYTPEDQAEFERIGAEIDRTYQAYFNALPRRWWVVADEEDADKSERVWTLSRDPKECGWETDSGCPSYGLTFAQATELADAANEAWERKKSQAPAFTIITDQKDLK